MEKRNRLITEELLSALKDYPLYSQDARRKDAICVAVFYIANIRWYILEGQPENDDFIFYGIIVGTVETEYGYASANEMADIKVDATHLGLGTLQVRQHRPFTPQRLADIEDTELQEFLTNLYDK